MEQTQLASIWEKMECQLDEKQKRLLAASMATAIGRGGIAQAHRVTGLAINTIKAGQREVAMGTIEEKGKIRRNGGGRKRAETCNVGLHDAIREIVDDSTYGNPENPLSWTTESLRKIAHALESKRGVRINYCTVGRILGELGYSKQANQKMLQIGYPHPDRNEQFEFINMATRLFIANGEPVISVDTKKKENLGNFKNPGQEYRSSGNARKVLDHDFPLKELGKLSPYGVYCPNNNVAFVNAGTSHDTAEFAVESISRWWEIVGASTFRHASRLYITCDSGGSNGYRVRMWKQQLQQLANRTSLIIYVSHFPPGTSKWNKVEHKLFCFISKNWQGKPLIDIDTAINLIGATKTTTGLKVFCKADYSIYELKRTVSDDEFASINMYRIGDHGEWNYRISPQ
jgi:transposase